MSSVTIHNISNFSIEQIVESGQAFRWKKEGNKFIGIAFGKVIQVIQENDNIIINGINREEYIKIWMHYFDMNRNYGQIINNLKGKDKHLDNAISFGSGIRILNQDVWEMIISFIISGNNNIPRIKKSIEIICEKYGSFIDEINGNTYYSFPSPKQLSVATLKDLRASGVGYRDSYIFETTKMINEGQVNLEMIKNMEISDARRELKKLKGVGNKVAECILLFSCGKTSAFPIDTWVKKILKEYYKIDTKNTKEINNFVSRYFGEYCGIAQQYLFYYRRNHNDTLKENLIH